jgi:acyl carrier protein
MTRAERTIREWLQRRIATAMELPLDYDLIANRAIDSLQFMEFIMLIEEVSGRPIDLNEVNVDNFRSIGVILEAFAPAPPVAQ